MTPQQQTRIADTVKNLLGDPADYEFDTLKSLPFETRLGIAFSMYVREAERRWDECQTGGCESVRKQGRKLVLWHGILMGLSAAFALLSFLFASGAIQWAPKG